MGAGPYPDNVPFVACLSWETNGTMVGTRNAKYYVIQMLATTLGSTERRIQPVTNSMPNIASVSAYYRVSTREKILLLVTKRNATIAIGLSGAGAKAGVDTATVIGGDLGGF